MNPILAIDFGHARIGTAISDGLQLLAHPLETIAANRRPISRITEIVRERKVDHVVVGIPRQLSGKIGTAASQTLGFIEKLRAILPCPVVTWDERLTTVAAHRALRETGKKMRMKILRYIAAAKNPDRRGQKRIERFRPTRCR